MNNSGLEIILANQQGFFDELQIDGFSKQTIMDYGKTISLFIDFLKTRHRLSKRYVFQSAQIDEFVQWKIDKRKKRAYHKSHSNRLAFDIAFFFDWYFYNNNSVIYNRPALEEQLDLYLNNQTFGHKRKKIEVKNELKSFFSYLDHKKIKALKRIDIHLVEKFITYKETNFYRKRSEYCNEYRFYVRSAIRRYFKYLIKKGITSLDISVNPPKERPPLAFSGPILNYLDFRKNEEGISNSTLWKTNHTLEKFDYFLQKKKVKEINRVKIIHLDAFIKKTYPSENLREIQCANSILRRFFKYLYFTDQITTDPSRHIIAAPVYQLSEVPKHLTSEELRKILSGIDLSTRNGIRTWAIFSLLLFNGLRVGEVAKLILDDIQWDEKEIVVRDRKNGDTLLTILSDHTLNALKEYILKVRPQKKGRREIFFTLTPPIRPMGAIAVSALVCRELKKYDISGGGHRVRHSFAHNLLESGSSLEEVQLLLGHDSIDSSRIYTKSSLSRMREHIVTDEI